MNTPSINPPKSRYKVRNRQAYNTSLSKQGVVIPRVREASRWRTLVSSRHSCCLLIRLNCRLPYLQSAGFLKSLFRLAGKESLPVPDYTTLCRRQKPFRWRQAGVCSAGRIRRLVQTPPA
ncbi:MAG: transposase [Dysgonamonadaceae bacterium]|nr:transposase [Dysgonamonadaceae bacterium]